MKKVLIVNLKLFENSKIGSDIYVIYATRVEDEKFHNLCDIVEMSVLAITADSVPVVVHMGINRTLTFLIKYCHRKNRKTEIQCKHSEDFFALSTNLAVLLFKKSAEFFVDKYGVYPETPEEAINSKAKKYIISRPANKMRNILMAEESFKASLYVSDAANNTEFQIFNEEPEENPVLQWYAEKKGSPIQSYGDDKSYCGKIYNLPVLEYSPKELPPGTFEIASWQRTYGVNKLLSGQVLGQDIANMEYLAIGDIGIAWLPWICLSLPLPPRDLS